MIKGMAEPTDEYLRDGVLYLRKSKGRAGIARQDRECRAYAKRTRIRIVEVFTDEDSTAFAKVGQERARRDDYLKMLKMLRADQRTPPLSVVAWHADRLHRRVDETNDFIETAAAGGNLVETPRSGVYDLSTSTGRKRLLQDALDAQFEVDHLIERLDASKLEAANEGRWLGGRRPFGFSDDGVTHLPEEADAIRWACGAVLAGVSIAAVAREWNRRGLLTPRLKDVGGKEWTANAARQTLLRPRNAGLMVHRGQIIETTLPGRHAEWEPIVAEETWRAAVHVLTDPGRRTTIGPTPRWLGSGIYRCGVCGATMRVANATGARRKNGKVYVCRMSKHLVRDQPLLDEFVSSVIVARLSKPDAADLLLTDDRPDLDALRASLITEQAGLEDWRRLAEAGEVTALSFARAEKAALARIEAIRGEMAHVDRAPILRDLIEADDVAVAWKGLPLDRQRAVVRLMAAVTVQRARPGRIPGWRPGEPYFDSSTVDVRPLL